MLIKSERKDWEGNIKDFPASEYYDVLNNKKNINILRYGTVIGSSIYDLFITFEYNGFNFSFATKNSEWSFKIQTGNQWECSGKGLDEFKSCVDILLSDSTFIKSSLPIYSFTLKELREAEDMNFIHRKEHLSELSEPEIKYVYANTIVLEIKSSHYGEKTKNGTNSTKYKIFILLEDFYTIGKDKDIDFEDAIDYAINFGDVHLRCTCPSFLYFGFAYQGTALKYLYGIPREDRFPVVRNPDLKSTCCKHCDKAIEYILSHKDIVAKMFATYYNRLNDGQSIYAVNTNGTTITIGKKNDEGDIFFERQVEEEQEMEAPEEKVVEEETQNEETQNEEIDEFDPNTWWDEESEESNVIEEE